MTTFFYRTLCSTGIFRTRGIFRILSNIHDVKFYSQPCITQNPRQIQNTVKHLSRNIYSKPCVTLKYSEPSVYLELCYMLKLKHTQNPVEYLRWCILLRTLCNYCRFRGPIYSRLSHTQNQCVSATP